VDGLSVVRRTSVVREIARNMERIESGNATNRVCLRETGFGGPACVCYRDADHPGQHPGPCGAEWR
jgi:hypothetical protein